jgi:hypothetical protein
VGLRGEVNKLRAEREVLEVETSQSVEHVSASSEELATVDAEIVGVTDLPGPRRRNGQPHY